MGNKSFFDFDYLVELSEQRLEQYSGLLHRKVEKFTTLFVIYSGLCIFLVPVLQALFVEKVKCHWSYRYSFFLFAMLFNCSLFYAIKLLLPEEIVLQLEPKHYYKSLKDMYKSLGLKDAEINKKLKIAYITELERLILQKKRKLLFKIAFYKRAFHFAIISCIPYLHCIWLILNSGKNSL